jgi:hypothetical protein
MPPKISAASRGKDDIFISACIFENNFLSRNLSSGFFGSEVIFVNYAYLNGGLPKNFSVTLQMYSEDISGARRDPSLEDFFLRSFFSYEYGIDQCYSQ